MVKPEEAVSSTTTHLVETDAFKIAKEEFRNQLSAFIVKILQHYSTTSSTTNNNNSNGPKYGRIENKDDFKYLARKLTHTIVEKEMTRVTATTTLNSCDDLTLTESKKVKAHEYVKNYMKKFPQGYSRKSDESKV